VQRLRGTAGVTSSVSIRRVVLLREDGPVQLIAYDFGARRRGGLPLKHQQGSRNQAWTSFHAGAVFVSEPFAFRHQVAPGDTLALPTARGQRSFQVAGVVYDYASDQGIVMIARSTYDQFWDDPAVSGLGLNVEAGRDVDAMIAALRPQIGRSAVLIRSNRALRRASMAIFDRTFAVTAVLRLLTLVVAFMGVLSAQLAIQLESTRQIGLLRALGLTRDQLWRLVGAQTGSVGLIAGLQAVPLGICLGAIMIFIINRRSFGWTMSMESDLWLLAQGVLVAVGAALVAGLYPSWKLGRLQPARALRAE